MSSCQRLSLTPLSYLWQRDQAELLSEMIAAGMQAVLIKVAGIGLSTRHLGKTLSEMQSTLVTLVGGGSLIVDVIRLTVIE
jgi:diphthine-ammonia ligase